MQQKKTGNGMKRSGVALTLVCLSFARSVRAADAVKPSPEVAALQQRVRELEKQVQALREDTAEKIQQRVAVDNAIASILEKVSLDVTVLEPSRPNIYQPVRLDSSGLILLVSIEHVEPYLDGYKIVLSIGNPSSAKLSGYDLTSSWSYDEARYRKKRSDTFTGTLEPGTWTKTELILPETSGSELRFVAIGIKATNVMLRRQAAN